MADPTLYLYTSLTAGSSHIITATSRLETILKANKIPFRALDCATDEKARTTWSRRSKGRKLPGLVKFGQVIGDLEQIEEWNEFGELHDQLDSVDDFFEDPGAAANPNTISLRPEPGPGVANKLTPIQPGPGRKPDQTATSNASSRASSESRHISISEPAAKDREAKSPQPASENPMTMTMRQLGAEAAAKAKEASRKTSGTTPKAVPTPLSSEQPATEVAPTVTPTSAKERESSDPSQEPEVTAAKTPAQLAAEGAKRTSIDKIESKSVTPTSPTSARATTAETNEEVSEPAVTSATKSTEEQVLDLRRQSTQVEQPSRLHESISAEPDDEVAGKSDQSEVMAEVAATKTATLPDSTDVTTSKAAPDKDTDSGKVDTSPSTEASAEQDAADPKITPATGATHESKPKDLPVQPSPVNSEEPLDSAASPDATPHSLPQPRSHRGSSVEIADRAEVQKIEEQIKIEEHPDEDEVAIAEDDAPSTSPEKKDETTTPTKARPAAADTKAGADAKESDKPQDTAAKDPEAAAKTVQD